MSIATRMVCLVKGKEGLYEFKVTAVECLSPKEQTIPNEFYIGNDTTVPEGVHWELRLTESPVWGRVNDDVPVHIYKHPVNADSYVCFTGQIETFEQAEAVFCKWCLGTAYTIENQTDFATLQIPVGVGFEEHLKTAFGINMV